MYHSKAMSQEFEINKNKKAFFYTTGIMGLLLAMFILISWSNQPPPKPLVDDFVEINLGNNEEGLGEIQPLVRGDMSNEETTPQQAATAPQQEEVSQPSQTDPNEKDNEAPELVKNDRTEKNATRILDKPSAIPTKTVQPAVVSAPVPKPQKPKITYPGAGTGGGNGAKEDNGYTMQGNGGKGDAGSPNGNPDSYGTKPGGRIGTGGNGGPVVKSGDRKIIKYYSFSGDYEKATIYAAIKVSPDGKGVFVGYSKGSTKTGTTYATAIRQYLQTMSFDKADHESTVVVQFNFNVN